MNKYKQKIVAFKKVVFKIVSKGNNSRCKLHIDIDEINQLETMKNLRNIVTDQRIQKVH